MKLITPEWPLPDNVRSVVSTRQGGRSTGPWASANFGFNSGDDRAAVARNRNLLQCQLDLPSQPQWLQQVHGTDVVEAVQCAPEPEPEQEPRADGVISRHCGVAAAVLSADCLPVLLCDKSGSVVAAVHAGWRGLAAGIIRRCVSNMAVPAGELMAYLGPAISQLCFQVGPEVQQKFLAGALDREHRANIANSFIGGEGDRLQADIYQLARAELSALGVVDIYGGDYCTFGQSDLFYSYRRDGVTGRMASLIWLL